MKTIQWITVILALSFGGLMGCQEKVIGVRNPYTGNPNSSSTQSRVQKDRDARLRLRSYSRHRDAKASDNPFASIGAFFGDLFDMLGADPTPQGLSASRRPSTTSFSPTAK